MNCPNCQGNVALKPVSYTWWGGWLGPRILGLARCPSCGARFNGRTGQSAEQAIRIYVFATFVLLMLVMVGIMVSTGS